MESERGLEPGALKVSLLVCGRAWRTLGLLLERRQGKQPTEVEYGNSNQKSLWGTQWEVSCSSQSMPQRGSIHERPLQEQRNCQEPFPSPGPHYKYRAQGQHSLFNLLIPNPAPPPMLWWNHPFQSQCSRLPSSEDQPKPLPSLCLPTKEFCNALVLVVVVTSLISQKHT